MDTVRYTSSTVEYMDHNTIHSIHAITLSALATTAATCLARSYPARKNIFWHSGSVFDAT